MVKLGTYGKAIAPKMVARQAYLTHATHLGSGFIEVRSSGANYIAYFRRSDKLKKNTVQLISTEELYLWVTPDTVNY